MMIRLAPVLLFLAVLFLLLMGITMQASALKSGYDYLSKQTMWVAVGAVVMLGVALLDYRWLKRLVWLLYAGAIVLLILCYVPGIGKTVGGESRWIVLPVLGQFQPSEPAKLVVILAMASWYSSRKADISTFWKGFVMPSVILGLPLLLIFFEKDITKISFKF